MDKNYLLTYQRIKKSCGCIETTFAWFDTEDEMEEFVEHNEIQIIDMIKINDVENLME